MTIKILSLNTWRGELLAEMLEYVGREQPDILMLQEVTNSERTDLPDQFRLRETLQNKLGARFGCHFAPTMANNRREGKIQEGNAIFSRYPIVDSSVIFFSGKYREDYVDIPENYGSCPRNLQHVTLAVGNHQLHIINFHGIWSRDGQISTPAHVDMVTTIMNEIDLPGQYIVGGDTNSESSNPAMRPLEQNCTNAFGNRRITSFNMRRKTNPAYGHCVVDLLYASPAIEILSAVSHDVDVSDHLPMLLTISLDDERQASTSTA